LAIKDIEMFEVTGASELNRPNGWKNLDYRFGKHRNQMLCYSFSKNTKLTIRL